MCVYNTQTGLHNLNALLVLQHVKVNASLKIPYMSMPSDTKRKKNIAESVLW